MSKAIEPQSKSAQQHNSNSEEIEENELLITTEIASHMSPDIQLAKQINPSKSDGDNSPNIYPDASDL